MDFNCFCIGNDMKYTSEGIKINEYKFKLKAPKPSYEIISTTQKKSSDTSKIDFKPTKQTFFSKKNIPKIMIDLFFYSIPKKDGKQLIAVHIINKCLTSKNPILNEPNLIFYCHENETDLLRLVPFLIDISFQMKCDIVSFDYSGFGCSSGKSTINNSISDGEEALNFTITFLKYKIENIIVFGNGIGAMSSIYLVSRQKYLNCKALILYMPLIFRNIIDKKVMRSIFCQTLLIKEFEDKNEISCDEIVSLCREIPNEKEWLPLRKRNKEIKKNRLFCDPSTDIDDSDNVYSRHRSKFIIKVRGYIYPDNEIKTRKRCKTSTIGESTDSDTIPNLSMEMNNPVDPMSMGKVIRNKNILNINFDDCDKKSKNQIELDNNRFKKYEQFDETEIDINNDEDY